MQRPGVALLVTGVIFCAGALGLLAYKVDYSTTSFFKHSVESVRGFDVLRQAFPAGTLAPTTILVESDQCPVSQVDIAAVEQKLRAPRAVAADAGVAAERISACLSWLLDAAEEVVAEASDSPPRARWSSPAPT